MYALVCVSACVHSYLLFMFTSIYDFLFAHLSMNIGHFIAFLLAYEKLACNSSHITISMFFLRWVFVSSRHGNNENKQKKKLTT